MSRAPMHRNPSVDPHAFAMIPRADIPRSRFKMDHTHKTTFSAARLVPVYLQEVLPGDSFSVRMTAFTRMATAIYPIMDNMYLESFFFFVPNRLVWTNWQRFMGEQDAPGASTSYAIPTVTSPVGGFNAFSNYTYWGLPVAPQLGSNTITVNVLPLRCQNLIWKEWFRDENMVAGDGSGVAPIFDGDGPDPSNAYGGFLRRGKRHDYFTSCLPFAQKGSAVTLPLGTSATVRVSGTELITSGASNGTIKFRDPVNNLPPNNLTAGFGSGALGYGAATGTFGFGVYPTNLYADLTTATANTINSIRQAFQIQRLLERDARGGTRYTEIVRSHFGVISPDARLQRPEYLGGGHSAVEITPVVQQTQTGVTGGATPLGTLGGIGANLARGHGFSRSFTEHGYILGFINVRADLSYQQGIRKLWTRSTRYDFYFPVFAMLGEQAVLNREIFCDGSANDALVFGYQERWGEYRYHPSMITGYFNSMQATPLDAWHLSQKFTAVPTLNQTFIEDHTDDQLRRALAAGAAADNQQFLADIYFSVVAARPMPMYSVPGLVDHF